MSFFHLTRVSYNRKTGPIPVVTSSSDTCPDTCALKNQGCYAQSGPLRLHWLRVDKQGLSLDQLCDEIRRFPRQQMWRYGQAGDLPTGEGDILKLANANVGRKVIAYTHQHDRVAELRAAALVGFHVNLSADNIAQADELATTGLPVVVVLSSEHGKKNDETLLEYRARLGGQLSLSTPAGNRVAICPATYYDTNCQKCGACATPRSGGTIIGFPVHGSRKRAADAVVSKGVLTGWLERERPPA